MSHDFDIIILIKKNIPALPSNKLYLSILLNTVKHFYVSLEHLLETTMLKK